MPLQGHVDIISHNLIAGWAADPDSPEEEVVIRVTVNGQSTRVAANIMRDNLVGRFEGATGRYGFRCDDAPLPLSPFIVNEIDVVFVKTGASLPRGRAILQPLGSQPPAPRTTCRPLVIASTGRAGSSLLMARLARHPGIAVAGGHPHEIKLLSYYATVLQTLLSAGDRRQSTHPDTMMARANRFFVGFNPYHDLAADKDAHFGPLWNTIAPDALRTAFRTIIDGYYNQVAAKQDKTEPQFLAEKIGTANIVTESAHFLFGAVDRIVLVRDPRDVICSSKIFWKRDFEESVRTLRGQFNQLINSHAGLAVRSHVVRYEELLNHPRDTLLAITNFLGLPEFSSEFDHEQEARVFAQHGTSASPAETIGRWRQEMSAEQIEIANRELAPFLTNFGYEKKL